MSETKQTQQQGVLLITGGIIVGLVYQLLPLFMKSIGLVDATNTLLIVLGTVFNALAMGGLLYFVLQNELFEWFRHFSFKWSVIGFPTLLVISFIAGTLSSLVLGKMVPNNINSSLTWLYALTSVPIMLLGEELLSLGVLYGAWKKLGWSFWQASLLCGVLFAIWHLPAYDFNLWQCLLTILPSRLVLNYLFKQTHSIWVTLLVHFLFDFMTFLPLLLK